nr:RNA-directed DNA polymerase, eukaryota, reverse transcriptase zinc-binding domain protein [Tanacetum cinerariifolium]
MTRLELFRLKSLWGNINFDYAHSMARGRSGCLISIWDPNFFSKEAIWCDDNFIIVKGHWNNKVGDCFMINIYGPQESAAKSSLWNHLVEFMNQHNGKFILFGDFNTVLHEYERSGSLFSRIEAEHFNAFIDSTCLIDLPIGGRHSTWMNKAGTKLSKFECFLISEGVMEDISDIKVTTIERLWSDHSPILLHSKKDDFGPSTFKLYISWLSRDGFDDIVKSTWDSMETGNGGNKISSHVKLRNLKNDIKKWQVDVRKIDKSHKSANLFEIHAIEKKIDDGSASISDHEKRIKLLQDIDKLENLEALDLIQKAHIKWDIEGDENSKFFHGIINSKKRTQTIACISHDGVWITEPPLIKDVFLNYYKDKFQAHDSQVIFTPISNSPILCHHDRDFLESHISLDEVKNAVWECGSNKAPGPDGFSFAFIKKYWDLMKMDIFEFVNSFFASSSMPQGANYSFFTLIPKISNPLSIKDFLPRSWIRACLHSSRASILINGSPTSEFSIKRGLRQADPLSPFLFILVMEGLNCAMSNAVNSGLIRGIKLGSSGIVLSYLFYADDVIITTDWNPHDTDNIIRVLYVFHLASGLKINIHKSNIFGIGVTNDEISSMASRTGCAAGCFPFTYLGLPIGANMNLTSTVLGSLGIYYLFIFKAPETILNSMESLRSRFFWGGSQDSRNMVWVKWSQVLSFFKKGGLQIGSLKAFNRALLQKWCWRLLSSPNNMWVNIIKVGCGTRVRFWNDIWIGDSPLHTRYNRLYRLDQDKDCLIIDRIVNDRLPHRLNLSSRGLDIPTISCYSCNGNVEYVDHVFFECDLVKEIRCLVRKWCDIFIPMFASYDTWNSWFSTWQATKAKSRRLYIIFAALFWWIWRYRNSVTFSSDSIKKDDLFDNICASSFSWISNRGHEVFKENGGANSWFSVLNQASEDFTPGGRIAWVEVEGIPFKLWS